MERTRSRLVVLGAVGFVLAGVVALNVLDQRAEENKSKIKITNAKPNEVPPVEGPPHWGSTPGFNQRIFVDVSFLGESDFASKVINDLRALAAKDDHKTLKVKWESPSTPAPADPPGGMFVINEGKEIGIVMPSREDLKKVPANYSGYLLPDFLKHVEALMKMKTLPWATAPAPKSELAGQPK